LTFAYELIVPMLSKKYYLSILFSVFILIFWVNAKVLKIGVHRNAPVNKWIAPSYTDTLVSPILPEPIHLQNGKRIYAMECEVCHGKWGNGDGEAGFGLSVSPGDLNHKGVLAESDGSLFWKIYTGKKPMPSFNAKLDTTEIWQVVLYIRLVQSENQFKGSHKRKRKK